MISDEEAKAVKEVAKLGSKSLETSEAAGQYLTRKFSTAIDHLAGAVADSAEGFKIRNRASVIAKTKKHLEGHKIESTIQPISERNIIPLIDAISLESDEEIQDVWAAYLARSIDPTQSDVTVDRLLIDLIKRLEPADLPILRRIFDEDIEKPTKGGPVLKPENFFVEENKLIASLGRLAALGLLRYDNVESVSFDPPEGRPCQLYICTKSGNFIAQYQLLTLKKAVQS